MLIAQLTDLHIIAPAGQLLLGVDTADRARLAIAHINGLRPRPDVVLVTGDLVNRGTPEEYAIVRTILEELAMPYYLVPGNHDHRANLVEAFGGHDYLPGAGAPDLQYTLEEWPVRLVGLDTLVVGQSWGQLDENRLAWLDRTLAEEPERPTLIFMHHPPIRTGIRWIDAAGLYGSKRLGEVVARHSQVERIICGHAHRTVHTRWSGTVVSIAPSSAYLQLALALGEDEGYAFGLVQESWSVPLFQWDAACGLIGHSSPIDPEAKIIAPVDAVAEAAKFRQLYEQMCRKEWEK